jgi:hypothetical protein
MNNLIWIIPTIFAIDNLSDMITYLDLFDKPRTWFQNKFPKLGKLVTCRLCQSMWLSGFMSIWFFTEQIPLTIQFIVFWLALHRIILFVEEFGERYFNQVPSSLFVTIKKEEEPKQEPQSRKFS